jgi:hypothetical protein
MSTIVQTRGNKGDRSQPDVYSGVVILFKGTKTANKVVFKQWLFVDIITNPPNNLMVPVNLELIFIEQIRGL